MTPTAQPLLRPLPPRARTRVHACLPGKLEVLGDVLVAECLALENATRRVPETIVYQSPSDANVLQSLPWQVLRAHVVACVLQPNIA